MAKDIVRFHAVYWPAFLMSVGLPLPKHLLVHGYILVNGQKMSKSLGNAVDPEQLAVNYGVEGIRYYMARQLPVTQDGNFDFADLEQRLNADLANNLGNLLNRVVTLATTNRFTFISSPKVWEPTSIALQERAREAIRLFEDGMNDYAVHRALADLWKFVSEVNAFVHASQPWVVVRTNRELFEEIIAVTFHSLELIGTLLSPILPEKMEQLLAVLGIKLEKGVDHVTPLKSIAWNKTYTINPLNQPLFPRIESKIVEAPIVTPVAVVPVVKAITIDHLAAVELVTGTILVCEPVKGSDKLYRLEVDMGGYGQRQVLSGIAKYFVPQDLINKQVIFVANRAPRKMMGMESQGMVLTAESEDGLVKVVSPVGVVPNGTRLK
jgi:methionyl-tRNA synthetase